MNNREEILAEINAIKILVWKLWKDSHREINEKDWEELKKEVVKKMRNNEKKS